MASPDATDVGWAKACTRPFIKTRIFKESILAQQIDIYTKFGCGYCYRAKSLLEKKGVEFNEYDITMGGDKRDEMRERAPNASTVPQIFIGDTHVGGSDELHALEREGRLDALLAG